MFIETHEKRQDLYHARSYDSTYKINARLGVPEPIEYDLFEF